jgi:predicted DNA-binding transcriptional regulator AlpA
VSEHLVVVLSEVQLDALAERIAARLSNGNGGGNGHHPPEPDTLLTADEAAKRLGMTRRWVYGHSSSLPFAVKLPNSRAVRFSERGIAKYVAKRMR